MADTVLPSNYHKAGPDGIGFDRTVATGSGATAQYKEPLASLFENPDYFSCFLVNRI